MLRQAATALGYYTRSSTHTVQGTELHEQILDALLRRAQLRAAVARMLVQLTELPFGEQVARALRRWWEWAVVRAQGR